VVNIAKKRAKSMVKPECKRWFLSVFEAKVKVFDGFFAVWFSIFSVLFEIRRKYADYFTWFSLDLLQKSNISIFP